MFSSVDDKVICYGNLTLHRICQVAVRLLFSYLMPKLNREGVQQGWISQEQAGNHKHKCKPQDRVKSISLLLLAFVVQVSFRSQGLSSGTKHTQTWPNRENKGGSPGGKAAEEQLLCEPIKRVPRLVTMGMSH